MTEHHHAGVYIQVLFDASHLPNRVIVSFLSRQSRSELIQIEVIVIPNNTKMLIF